MEHTQRNHRTSWIWPWLQACLFVAMVMFITPMTPLAQEAHAAQPSASRHVWVRIHVERAAIWPTTAKGTCWDPCGWSRPKLPMRQLKPYEWYLKNKAFKGMTSGWKAPDVQVTLRFGKTSWTTPVRSDTTMPKWNVSKIISLDPLTGWEVEVADKDAWGKEIIGTYRASRLHPTFIRGGVYVLRKVGQIEMLRLRIEPLRREDKTEPKPLERKQVPAARRTLPVLPPVDRKPVLPRQVEPRPMPTRKAPPVSGGSMMGPQPPTQAPQKAPKADRTNPKNPAKQAPTKGEEERFFRVTIKEAHLWPLKADGYCWDYCFTKSKMLPPRGLRSFDSYYVNPAFKKLAKARYAPDAWLKIKVGKREWRTHVINDTLRPKWNKTFLVKATKRADINISIHDRDWFGSSQLIGAWKQKKIPASWAKGGTLVLREFGQVERLQIEVEPLVIRPQTSSIQAASRIPSHVRFVKVTVVKARLWPLTAKKQCWDTCTTWNNPSLPPRGLPKFSVYMKDSRFRSVATGRPAPDARVKIKVGKYDMFITPTVNNSVQPTWNASHIFRLRGNEPMEITVSDDDQNVAHDLLRTYRSTRELMQRWSEQVIGSFKTNKLPVQMVEGGRLILRSFGQVEYLELKIEPLPVNRTNDSCEGVYRVRMAELTVKPTRADGRPWHAGVGSMSRPSPYSVLWLGTQKLETPVAYKRLSAIYQTSRIIPIRKDTTMSIDVRDYSVGLRLSFDRQIKIPFLPLRVGIGMKNEPASQSIGQTAFFSACSLIKKAKNGVVRLPSFGQVKSTVLFFDKLK